MFTLGFSQRVSKASVKNFQIVLSDNNNVILEFGKTGNNDFSMDVAYPLSIFQAFAICLSSFDYQYVYSIINSP